MTSNYLENDLRDPLSTQSGDDQSAQDVAKHQAGQLGQQATGASQHVASVAKDQTREVAGEARKQAKDLLGQARSEFSGQASEQQQKLAAGIRSLGDELQSMSTQSQQSGMVSDLARQAAERTHTVAEWLESREPGSLVGELRSFARERPVVFLAAAAGLGLAAGRLTRGIKDDTSGGSDGSSGGQSAQSAAGGQSFIGGPSTYLDSSGSAFSASSDPFAASGIEQTDLNQGAEPYRPSDYGNSGFGEEAIRPYSTSQGAFGSDTFREDTP